MLQIPYAKFLQGEIMSFAAGEPILTRELAHRLAVYYTIDEKAAAKTTAVTVKRLMDAQRIPTLRCFQKGIYYLCRQTVFGETGIDKQKLIEQKYLLGGSGYETGAGIMHKLGLTSLMPCQRVFVSNRMQKRAKKDEMLDIIVKPPRTPVTPANRAYLQFLDILSVYDEVPVDAQQPYALLHRHIQNCGMQYQKLLALADRYYGQETILRLARIANEQEADR